MQVRESARNCPDTPFACAAHGIDPAALAETVRRVARPIWRGSELRPWILGIRDPRCRALRHPRQVMKKLDSRLVPRALRLIDAGRVVMRNEGRSPFGWMVYYSDADTFVYYPVPPDLHPTDRPGVDPPDDGTPTPRPNPRARGPGSGSGK